MGQGTRDRNGTSRGTRDEGRKQNGTRGVGRGTKQKMGGRGFCRAKTTANGDWRLATGKTAASSEWQMESSRWFFPESTALPCRKISVVWELNWRAALLSSRIRFRSCGSTTLQLKPKRRRMANSEWFSEGQCSCTAEKICLTIALRTLCSPLHACTHARTSAEASGKESFRTRYRSLYIGQGSCYNGKHTPCVGCECCCSKTILGCARRCWVGRRSR